MKLPNNGQLDRVKELAMLHRTILLAFVFPVVAGSVSADESDPIETATKSIVFEDDF